jgi:hypothetical protein
VRIATWESLKSAVGSWHVFKFRAYCRLLSRILTGEYVVPAVSICTYSIWRANAVKHFALRSRALYSARELLPHIIHPTFARDSEICALRLRAQIKRTRMLTHRHSRARWMTSGGVHTIAFQMLLQLHPRYKRGRVRGCFNAEIFSV